LLLVCSQQDGHEWGIDTVKKPIVRALLADLQPYSQAMKEVITSLVCRWTCRKQAEDLLQLPVFAALPDL